MSNKFNIQEAFINVLRDMHRNLHKRMQELRSESTLLHYDVAQFEYYFSSMQKLLGESGKDKLKNIWSLKSESDPYEDLKGLKVKHKGKEVTLFSESYLYETIGKEDARTVLALLNSIYVDKGKVGGF